MPTDWLEYQYVEGGNGQSWDTEVRPWYSAATLSSGYLDITLLDWGAVFEDVPEFSPAGGEYYWAQTVTISCPTEGAVIHYTTDGSEPTETDLFEAASIAAYHSKGIGSQNVPVDYTKVRYVKKPSGAKPGFVIFTHNRTLYVDPKLPE